MKLIARLLALTCFLTFAHIPAFAQMPDLNAMLDEGALRSPAVSLPDVPVPSRPSGTETSRPGEWTVMMYMNGKNDLADTVFKRFNEIETTGSTDKIAITAELGFPKKGGQGFKGNTRRYLISKDNDAEKINSRVLQEIKNADMGDYRHLADFVNWAKQNFPAKRYMLVIVAHGQGWRDVKSKSISGDDDTGSYIATEQLKTLTHLTGHLDILTFNSCLMQMAEVAYEIKDNVGIVVGSQERMPARSFDYPAFLNKLSDDPRMPPEELAGLLVDTYRRFYSENNIWGVYGVTISAIRPKKLEGLLPLINDWTDEIMSTADTLPLGSGLSQAVRFGEDWNYDEGANVSLKRSYGDLHNFMKIIHRETRNPRLKEKSLAVMNYVENELVIKNGSLDKIHEGAAKKRTRYEDAHGISIELPPWKKAARPDNKYSNLGFAKDGRWDDFIKWAASVWPGK